jgi:membrane-associated phospholipid phosphatase
MAGASGSQTQKPVNNIPIPVSFGVRARLTSWLGLKLALALLLNLWIFLPYQFLQHHHFFPVIVMTPGFCDRLIPFSDTAVWWYLSIYLLMPLGPFLTADRRPILRYAAGVVIIGLLADLIFIFWPTVCVRPDSHGANSLYRALIAVDNPFHAFPSLHATFAVYSALCAQWALRESRHCRLWRAGLWLWTLLILFATLATKQHLLADIVAGSVLGTSVYFCVFNHWQRRSNGKTSGMAAPNLGTTTR